MENHECFLELWDLSLHEMDNTQPARAAGQVIDSKLAIPCIGNFCFPHGINVCKCLLKHELETFPDRSDLDIRDSVSLPGRSGRVCAKS